MWSWKNCLVYFYSIIRVFKLDSQLSWADFKNITKSLEWHIWERKKKKFWEHPGIINFTFFGISCFFNIFTGSVELHGQVSSFLASGPFHLTLVLVCLSVAGTDKFETIWTVCRTYTSSTLASGSIFAMDTFASI